MTNSNSFDSAWVSSDLANLADLPSGVLIRALDCHVDARGELTELFRASWSAANICQWNFVRSKPGTLRGVHVHVSHTDYLVFVKGRVSVALSDLRHYANEKFTGTKGFVLNLDCSSLISITIPPGVAHGFYFVDEASHFYGTSAYFDIKDELGCIYNDPALGLTWHPQNPILSERDRSLPPLAELLSVLRRGQA